MKSRFSKTVPRVEVFEDAGSRLHVDGQNPANAFEYNHVKHCQTSYTPNLYACSVRNAIVFHRREKTIQIHFKWTRIVLRTDKLIFVFKNICIRVDILKLKRAGTFPLSY